MACSCPVCRSGDARDKRLRSSLHVATHNKSILIDAGPDLRQQVLRAGIEWVDALLLTHAHRDHLGGLGELRSLVLKHKQAIPLYASAYVLECIRKEFAYLFTKKTQQAVSNFKIFPIEGHALNVNCLTVVPIQVYHHALPIWGFRIGELTYITDAKVIAEEEVAKMRGTTVLVVNALQQAPHPSHFNLKEAITLAQTVNAKVTYLTHISHHLGFYQAVSKKLPRNIHLAYDGLRFNV
mmetsp:Transcript_6349/g.14369  ORF Transcript_6349/g.14369 Transcript_6349/m.14369 type:complete len:238 (+) Transcript_6349:2615-3328(+)